MTQLGFITNYVKAVEMGAITGDLYSYGSVSSPQNTFVTRFNSSNQILWEKVYVLSGLDHSFEVDSSETNIYLAQTISTRFELYQLSATNGSVKQSKQVIGDLGVVPNQFYLKLVDSTDILFFSATTSLQQLGVCQTDVSTLTSLTCIIINDMNVSKLILPITSSDVFYATNTKVFSFYISMSR